MNKKEPKRCTEAYPYSNFLSSEDLLNSETEVFFCNDKLNHNVDKIRKIKHDFPRKAFTKNKMKGIICNKIQKFSIKKAIKKLKKFSKAKTYSIRRKKTLFTINFLKQEGFKESEISTRFRIKDIKKCREQSLLQKIKKAKKELKTTILQKNIKDFVTDSKGIISKTEIFRRLNKKIDKPKKTTIYAINKAMKYLGFIKKRVRGKHINSLKPLQSDKEQEFLEKLMLSLWRQAILVFVDETAFNDNMLPDFGYCRRGDEVRLVRRAKSFDK